LLVQILGPVVIFLLQLVEGRLSSSPYSLVSAILYGSLAIPSARTRRRAIRAAVLA
jgi:hypothetical protein